MLKASLILFLYLFSYSDVECLWRVRKLCHFERPQWRCDGAALQHRWQVCTRSSSLSENTLKQTALVDDLGLNLMREKNCCVCFSMLFSASTDKTVGVWDSETGERIKRLKGHTSFVNTCYPARRGPQLICTGSDDGTVKVRLLFIVLW